MWEFFAKALDMVLSVTRTIPHTTLKKSVFESEVGTQDGVYLRDVHGVSGTAQHRHYWKATRTTSTSITFKYGPLIIITDHMSDTDIDQAKQETGYSNQEIQIEVKYGKIICNYFQKGANTHDASIRVGTN